MNSRIRLLVTAISTTLIVETAFLPPLLASNFEDAIHKKLNATEDSALRLEALRFMVADDIIRGILGSSVNKIAGETAARESAIEADRRKANAGFGTGVLGILGVVGALAATGNQNCKDHTRALIAGAGLSALASAGGFTTGYILAASNRKKLRTGFYDQKFLLTEDSPEYKVLIELAMSVVAVVLDWTAKNDLQHPENPKAFEQLTNYIDYDLLNRAKSQGGGFINKKRPIAVLPGISDLTHGRQTGMSGFDLLYILKKTNLWSQFESMSFQRTRRLVELGKSTTDFLNLTEKEAGSPKHQLATLKAFTEFLKEAKQNLEKYLATEPNYKESTTKIAIAVIDDYLASVEKIKGDLK